jgi:PhnB protein
MVQPIPSDYPRLIPYLYLTDTRAAMDFYEGVLGFERRGEVMVGPDGRVGHAEMALGDSVLMLTDEYPEIGAVSPMTVGGASIGLLVYLEDVDAAHRRALDAGATELSPPEDQFYGDRAAHFEDPFGYRWKVASHVEDVPPEEMARRAEAWSSDG